MPPRVVVSVPVVPEVIGRDVASVKLNAGVASEPPRLKVIPP